MSVERLQHRSASPVQTEHPLHPVQHGQQALPAFPHRIHGALRFGAPFQLDKQNTVAPGVVADIALRGGTTSTGTKACSPAAVYHARVDDIYPASPPPSPAAGKTLHASSRSLQTPQQAPVSAKLRRLCFTPNSLIASGASLNAEREQSALLRRIRSFGEGSYYRKTRNGWKREDIEKRKYRLRQRA